MSDVSSYYAWEKSIRQLLADNVTAVRNLEISYQDILGNVRMGLLSAELFIVNKRRYVLQIINDITERKKLENELRRLQQLHLVGEIAAGIGHEIRNPMTAVRGFLQLLESKSEFIQYKEYFDIMISELDRANLIIIEFLSLARNKTSDKKLHNLNTIVTNIFPLLQAEAMKSDKFINVELNMIPDIFVDINEMRQLIYNLVDNGLDSMTHGGNLAVKTFMADERVVLSVHDEGEGIAPAVLEKIGTPFYTTKDGGTGLGLAVCYSIAARHNAQIEIETGSGGTTFYVKFGAQAGHAPGF